MHLDLQPKGVTHCYGLNCCCLVAKLCLTLLWPHGVSPSRFLCPWDFPHKNIGVGSHSLLLGFFPTHELNPHLLHWQMDSLPPSHHELHPLKIHVEAQTHNIMVFADGVLGRQLVLDDLRGWGPHRGISVFIKAYTTELVHTLSLSLPCEGTIKRWLSASQEKHSYQKSTMLVPWPLICSL